MNIITAIVKNNYAATEAQVETLAHAVVVGKQGESTYLRIIAQHCKAILGKGKRPLRKDTQESVIDQVHARFYPHVQKGVVSNGLSADEMPTKEVNRRSTFARSSASELRAFVNKGGDIRALDVDTLTRNYLRVYGVEVPTGTRAERSFVKSVEAAVRAAVRIAKTDAEDAKGRLRAMIAQLEEQVEKIEEAQDEAQQPNEVLRATPDRHTRTRVGVPQLRQVA